MKCIEDEIPFELPDGWAWTRLGNIGEWKSGATPNRKCLEYYNGDIPWVKTGDLNDDYIKEIPETITKKALKETSVSLIPKDTVLIAMYGATIGKLGITTCEVTTNQACCACCNLKEVNKKFLFYFLMQYKSNFISMAFGGAQPNISKEKIVQVIIPIPPIEEQNKITAKLTELFVFVETIESDKSTLQSTIQQTKSKILDLAIRGKLVPQDPNDEPASVLLERIRAEKEELIKQGKIKRDKKESVIFKGDDNSYYLNKDGQYVDIGDEIPFDIPNSWEWTLLGNIVQLNPRNKISDDMEVSFVPMPLIDDGFSGNHASEIRKWNDVKTGFTHFAEGDIGVAKITPCFENRKSTIFKNLCNGYGAGTTELHILRTYADTISHKFLLSFVKTDYFIQAGKQTFSGAVGQQRIGKEYISNSLFPLPPLAEQKRIVNTIEELFAQIDKIVEQIS